MFVPPGGGYEGATERRRAFPSTDPAQGDRYGPGGASELDRGIGMAHQGDGELPRYTALGVRLTEEFKGVHNTDNVVRCVSAAWYGAEEVRGATSPDVVERIARRHLEAPAAIDAEKRRRARRSAVDNAP